VNIEMITRIPEPLPRCPCCKRRASAPLSLRGDYLARWAHAAACRTRWDFRARRRCDDLYFGWMDRQGWFVPHYGATPPRHRFAAVVA